MSDQSRDLRLGYLHLLNEAGLGKFEELWPEEPHRIWEKLIEANTSLGILQENPREDLVNRLIEVAKERRFGVVLMSDLPGDDDTSFWPPAALILADGGEEIYGRIMGDPELPGDETAELPGDDDTPFWDNEG